MKHAIFFLLDGKNSRRIFKTLLPDIEEFGLAIQLQYRQPRPLRQASVLIQQVRHLTKMVMKCYSHLLP